MPSAPAASAFHDPVIWRARHCEGVAAGRMVPAVFGMDGGEMTGSAAAAKIREANGLAPGAPAAPGAAPAPAAPGATQLALAWSDGGTPRITAEDANGRKRYHRGLRGDGRRVTEYLAGRGRLPIENLHGIAGLPAEKAIARLRKLAGMTIREAYDEWTRLNEFLAPYTAAKLASLDGIADLPLAMGAGLQHWLAASAIGRAVAPRGDNPELPNAAPSQEILGFAEPAEGNLRNGLPPKAAD